MHATPRPYFAQTAGSFKTPRSHSRIHTVPSKSGNVLPPAPRSCLVRATNTAGGMHLLNEQRRTQTAPAEQRAGTYERDEDVTWLLYYGTDTIYPFPRSQRGKTIGSAIGQDIVLPSPCVSGHHLDAERKARGVVITDAHSKNGTAYEVKRDLGLRLKPSFEDKRTTEGFVLEAGMTFVVGAEPHRFVGLDDAMRASYEVLTEILGTEEDLREDERRRPGSVVETPSPSNFILAAAGPGHMLITGKRGCGQEELAQIVHRISKRRDEERVDLNIASVPADRKAQSAILKNKAAHATLVLNLGTHRERIDPAFVSSLFSPTYQIRVIVVARTLNQARRALGHAYVCPMMHVPLAELPLRKAAIRRLLDMHLAARGSPLRFADLTPANQEALRNGKWRENLDALRETAVRLDAIVRARFSRRQAAIALGIARQNFYNWYGSTVRLTKPLVPQTRARALTEALPEAPSASS